MKSTHYQAIVIGAGPAGLTAGIYLSRAKISTLILDSGVAGGQMVLSYEIANYPGFENISGYELSNRMKKQAKSFGCDLMSGISIHEFDFASELKSVILSNGKRFTADTVILATGGRSRSLGIEGEEHFKGKGISYCATCDGDFFTDKEIAVVGGGNAALEEAVSLTKYASRVTLIHMLDHFQAFEHAQQEVYANPKIDIKMNSRIVKFNGNEALESITVEDMTTGSTHQLDLSGVFIFIGYEANTDFINGRCIHLNERQEVVVDSTMQTNISGVFAAGDANAKRFRQITLATADGTLAALHAIEYLNRSARTQNEAVA
ncbi:MAG: FAD-dependent oxidoreductase [Bacteroidales bacterium]|jgi:thioredoxin reductase (NADPH)|nr:FAD-dependent oxidoreductase [Bacteroidales bacterium]MDD3702363.1 FAD-dependent oxidoreductase [Bacteroidales bacterium]MDY0369136.1 FAD-dependent oxidoreductase [Bacteroidales bacterium]